MSTLFVYVYEGAGTFCGTSAKKGEVLRLSSSGDVHVKASSRLGFMLLAGEPLREPIVQHGPFVMSTQDQIMQAFQDYHSGNFLAEECTYKLHTKGKTVTSKETHRGATVRRLRNLAEGPAILGVGPSPQFAVRAGVRLAEGPIQSPHEVRELAFRGAQRAGRREVGHWVIVARRAPAHKGIAGDVLRLGLPGDHPSPGGTHRVNSIEPNFVHRSRTALSSSLTRLAFAANADSVTPNDMRLCGVSRRRSPCFRATSSNDERKPSNCASRSSSKDRQPLRPRPSKVANKSTQGVADARPG